MTKQLTIIHTECSLNWGGQEQRVFQELMEMKARGHRVILVTPSHSALSEKCKKNDIKVFNLLFTNERFLLNVFKLRKIFNTLKADVVNPHSSKDGWVGVLAARLSRVPCIIRSRHIEVDYPNRFISQYAFKGLPHHVITTSERIRRRLIDELGVEYNRIDTIPTGVDTDRFCPLRNQGILRDELGISKEKKIVGMISVLRSWKGHRYFIEAAKQLSEDNDDLHFVIVGDGPQKKDIQLLLQEFDLVGKVSLLGHREDVPNVLADFNLLVLPSTGQEGIPQIVLQAQAMKIPVVGTRIGGIPEVIQDGVTGRLVPPGDSTRLSCAISEALKCYSFSCSMAEKAAQMVYTNHSLREMGNRLELIYSRYVPGYRPILL